MKKAIVTGAFIAAVLLSFFAGSGYSRVRDAERKAQRRDIMISFSIEKLENLQTQYDEDMMEALISNVYAAYEYSSEESLASALHELWNELIFAGERISGKEDDLARALENHDAQEIESIVYEMRTET